MINSLSIEWEYEDDLPEMSDVEYSLIYEYSKVDGVRLFPFVRIWNQLKDCEEKFYLGA